jgi:hypothetical protein
VRDAQGRDEEVEVSFVIPCLDEAETLEGCIEAARRCIRKHDLDGEILVADNGSRDGSPEIARRGGARVVHVAERGYGAALMGGFDAARGRYLVMADADGSYDFEESMPLIERLRAGADLVMGSRFRGRIEPGAMPPLHRYLGNPLLSFVGRRLFHTRVSDFHCGLRALSRDAYRALGLRTTGMEFASEMVAKAAVKEMRIDEVPITLHRDRRSGAPHLRSFRDGWRHLRFMMTLSPRFTLGIPGAILAAIGLVLLSLVATGPVRIRGVELDIHTMLGGSLLLLVGYQAMTTALAARIYALEEEIGPPARWMQRAFRIFTLERGLLAGAALVLAGLALVAWVAWSWAAGGFGDLEIRQTLRPMVGGITLIALGIQTLLMSFVYSMLGIKRRRGAD